MNTITSFFFRNWIRCVVTSVALGAVLGAVQQGMSRRHPPAVGSAPPPEARAFPDPVAAAERPQVETPVAAAPKESSSVLAGANVVAPVSRTLSGQIIPPPLARAVAVSRSAASPGLGSSGNGEAPRLNPPLAFTVNSKNLAPQQQTVLAGIQDQFLKAIGDANQDPADPAYSQRWMSAQAIADQTYRADFGWTAFTQMQAERAGNSYTEIQVP
jgi:hypothetical protein